MQIAFTFRAKRGREEELEALMCDVGVSERLARAMGATKASLFCGRGTVVRVFEFPDGVTPPQLPELVRRDPEYAKWLAQVGPLVEEGPDAGSLHSLQAFQQRTTVPLALEVTP